MCELCRAFGSYYSSQFHPESAQSTGVVTDNGPPTPAYASVVGVGATGDQNADGLLSGYRWSGTLTYSFPTSASAYGSGYGFGEPTSGFAPISSTQQAVVHRIMGQVENLTNLQIEYSTSNTADIRLAQSSAANPTAYAYYPNSYYSEGGDVWFGTSYNYTNPKLGDYYYATHLHELGHALGLKHGQSADGVAGLALPADRDGLEFSVMTYRSYVGGPITGYTNETFGYPQSYMMNDILALQTMYGADYTFNGGETVYSWNANTGETYVNGVGQGTPGGSGAGASANRVFITIWDGGGEDTYNLSNYTNNVFIDLRPGSWSTTSAAQKAYLGSGHYAQGNVYNAYLFGDDPRSYIENAVGGSGNDTLRGNAIANRLDGGAGNDTLTGDAGDDVFVYHFGSGADIITDFFVGGTDDQIELLDFSFIDSFAEAMGYAAQVGANTVFTFGTGSTLTLLNALIAAFTAADFMFAVPDDPNEAPTDIDLSTTSVTENAAACVVGNLVVADPDGDQSFTFTVSDSRFQVVGVAGDYQLKLKAGIALDFEVEPTVTLTVTATDWQGLSFAKQFTLDVIDACGVTIYGTSAADTVDSTRTVLGEARPTADDDTIYGLGGNDVVKALAGNDQIDGGIGDDTLYGNDGNDTIAGGAGADKLYGEAGNDTFVVSGLDDQADTFSGGVGTDRILVAGTGDLTLAAFSAATASIEVIEGNGAGIVGNAAANTLNFAGLTALSGVAYIDGAAGNDVITGSAFADDLRGGVGNDTLSGGGGDDVLAGGAGVDRLSGDDGNDTFVVTGLDDQTDTFLGGAGTDKILVTGTGDLMLAAFNAGTASIEALEGNGWAIVGNSSANTLNFAGLTAITGVTYIDGGSGNDVITGSALADDLRGGVGDDTLYGGGSNDLLMGGAGADKMYGEDGDDTFVVSGLEALTDTFSGGNGTDKILVVGTGDLTLGAFNAGTSSIEVLEGNSWAIVGNTSANTLNFGGLTALTGVAYIDGGSGNDVITGSAFADDLRGGLNDDTLYGGSSDDVLTGGAGADKMYGEDGDDTFVVSGVEALTDTFSGGNGTDKVLVVGTGDLTLAAFNAGNSSIEVLQGNGWAIVGNTSANTLNFGGLTALTGVTYIDGGSGSDVITGSAFADDLRGGADNDTLYGGASDDLITGGAGVDKMYGEDGDDTFIVSGADAQTDLFDGGNGTDKILVIGTANLTLAAFNAGTSSIEVLQGNGAAIVGNSSANTLSFAGLTAFTGVTYIDGGSGNDVITGSAFADNLRGGSENDTLYGGGSDDVLTGGTGADKMYGEDGDDTFVISGTDAQADTFSGGNGTDKILVTGASNLTLTVLDTVVGSIEVWEGNGLAVVGTFAADSLNFANVTAVTGLAYVDGGWGNDTITGSAVADDLRGGAGDDTLYGSGGNDLLAGGAGIDKLYGEDGDDTFVVTGTEAQTDTFSGGDGVDKIVVTGASSLTLAGLDTTTASIEVWEGNGSALLGTSAANTFNLSNLTIRTGLSYVDGSSGDDTLIGSDLVDDLRGGVGNDQIAGGGGDDLIRGGAGLDTLQGGGGADRFVFAESGTTNRDTILDYSFAENDVLDLSALLDAGFGSTSNVSNFVRLTTSGQDLIVQIDNNGPVSGALWTDVAYLSGAAAAGQVLVYFEQQAQTLSAA